VPCIHRLCSVVLIALLVFEESWQRRMMNFNPRIADVIICQQYIITYDALYRIR